jgi:hypothetical protein
MTGETPRVTIESPLPILGLEGWAFELGEAVEEVGAEVAGADFFDGAGEPDLAGFIDLKT